MEHGRGQQGDVMRRVGHLGHAAQQGGPKVAMREHHTLGKAGGATGVDNRSEHIGRAAHIFHGACRSDFFFQRQIALGGGFFAHVKAMAQGRQGIGHGLCDGHQGIVHSQRAGAAVVQGVGHFGRCPAGVDRVDHQPRPGPGQQQLDHAVAVERQHRQALARLQTQRTQR